jgi:hypothetical protein
MTDPVLLWKIPAFIADDLPRSDIGMSRRVKTWEPGGIFKTKVANFSGGSSIGSAGFSLYGVDGENPAWVYDGTSVQFIETGRAHSGQKDAPNSLAVLPTQQLALGYEDGMLTLSSIGAPSDFSVSSGSAEIAVSDKIIDLATQPNDVLAIFCEASLRMLSGKTAADFQLSVYSEKLSLTPGSLQPLGDSIFLTDDGITRLNRVQEFGDFKEMALTAKIKPLIDKLKRDVSVSWAVTTRNEYWLQYSKKVGIIVKFIGAEVAGISTFRFPDLMTCTIATEHNGSEGIFAGTEEGFIQRMEAGDSFDGVEIPAYFTSVYEFLGSVEHRKRMKKLQLEVQTDEFVELQIRAELDYASKEAPVGVPHFTEMLGGGGFYDLDLFDNVLWSDTQVGLTDTYLTGVGRNISVTVYSLSDREPPHTLGSMILHWAMRGRRA